MTEPPPETLAWLHQAARIDGATYAQVLLIILERLELLEKAQEDADHFPGARKMVLTPKPAPVATHAGGLVEMVAYVIGDDPLLLSLWEDDARAAIREVAAWLDRQGQHGCSLLLRQEADNA